MHAASIPFPPDIRDLVDQVCSLCAEFHGYQVCSGGRCVVRDLLPKAPDDAGRQTLSTCSVVPLQPNRGTLESIETRLFSRPLEEVRRRAPMDSRSKAAWDFIESNFTDATLSLDQAAKISRMSRTRLNVHLKEQFGGSFLQLLVRLRLLLAIGQMTHDGPNLLEIAEASGFGSFSSFYRHFRHHFGCSPREFRARQQ